MGSSIPTVVVTTSILARLQLLCVELRLVARSVLLLPAEQEESVVERRTRKRIKLDCVAYLLALLHCKIICKHIVVRKVTERPPEIKKNLYAKKKKKKKNFMEKKKKKKKKK